VVEDREIAAQGKRWLVVRPVGGQSGIVLGRASTAEQVKTIGDQTGGRVFLFLRTEDFWGDFRKYQAKGVEFVREPKQEAYGWVAVFKDVYGNLWDLVEGKV